MILFSGVQNHSKAALWEVGEEYDQKCFQLLKQKVRHFLSVQQGENGIWDVCIG